MTRIGWIQVVGQRRQSPVGEKARIVERAHHESQPSFQRRGCRGTGTKVPNPSPQILQ
jgi:hypothetical protein